MNLAKTGVYIVIVFLFCQSLKVLQLKTGWKSDNMWCIGYPKYNRDGRARVLSILGPAAHSSLSPAPVCQLRCQLPPVQPG